MRPTLPHRAEGSRAAAVHVSHAKLVCGEAAGSTYSFTGDGIGKALQTGMLAARSLIEYLGLVPMTDDQAARRAALPGVFA